MKTRKVFTCEDCGCSGYSFHLHHIDGDHENNEIGNHKRLCPACHGKYSSTQAIESRHIDTLDILTHRLNVGNRIAYGYALLSDADDS